MSPLARGWWLLTAMRVLYCASFVPSLFVQGPRHGLPLFWVRVREGLARIFPSKEYAEKRSGLACQIGGAFESIGGHWQAAFRYVASFASCRTRRIPVREADGGESGLGSWY